MGISQFLIAPCPDHCLFVLVFEEEGKICDELNKDGVHNRDIDILYTDTG